MHAHAKPVSRRGYIFTYLGLLLLSALTFGLSFAPLGRLHIPVALLIAAAKGTFIAFIFMHLIEQRVTNRIAFLAALILLALLVTLTAADVATRHPGLLPTTH